jgi:2-polyprenyl-6-hydroxyphenyl methylase/3-demethylubiquinone-9 3-methyltransferase
MRKPEPRDDWPESWKLSYHYDLLEVFGEGHRSPGYARAYASRRARALELVRQVAEPGARVLDVAAAQGNFSLTLAEAGFRVTWNDLREELIDYVKLKHESGELHFLPGQILELPPPEPPFDVVVATEVIEHVAHPDEFLRKLATFVRPGGHLVMTTPNGRFLRNDRPRFSEFADPSVFESKQFAPDGDGHIFLLHPDEVRTLAARAGLEVVELSVLTSFLTAGWMGTGPLARRLPQRVIDSAEGVVRALPAPVRERLTVSMAFALRRP